MTNTRHQDFTTGNPKVFFMVEAAYHYAAKFNTQAEAAKYAFPRSCTASRATASKSSSLPWSRYLAPCVVSKVGGGFLDSERDYFWAEHRAGRLVGKTVEVLFQDVTTEISTTSQASLRFPRFKKLKD